MIDRFDLWVIEDNPNDVELMRRALSRVKLDLRVEYFSEGLKPLELLNRTETTIPRLILLDLKLPRVDGREILRRLRAHPKTKATPVVVLTSSQQDSDIRDCYVAGANSYLVKPVDFSKFAQSVETLGTYWLTLNTPPL